MKQSLTQMRKAAEEAPYHSMGTKPPQRAKLLQAVMEDEFQRGKEAGPSPRAMPKRDEMVPTPEEEARMRRQVEDERMLRKMGEQYDRAAPESMKAKGGKIKGYAQGGSVSSASKRADGCAERGKTKGRFI
jgi:hypothetical protein